jgi:hypothetical protein
MLMAGNNSESRSATNIHKNSSNTSTRSAIRLLHPGLGIKRWLLPLLIGVVILGLGVGLFLRELYGQTAYPPLLRFLLLQDFPRWIRGSFFVLFGVTLVGLSLFQLNKILLEAFIPEQATVGYVADRVYHHRRQASKRPQVSWYWVAVPASVCC